MVKLSPSRIKTLLDCTWRYQANYIYKIPDKGNDGSSRGNVTHFVLDCLINQRHRGKAKLILKTRDPFSVPSVERMIRIHAKKQGVADEGNIEMIKSFILTALETDFFCEGSLNILNEQELEWKEEGKFHLGGRIDKIAFYADNLVKVFDYKTSKSKIGKAGLNWNLQNLAYSYLCYKHYGVIPQVTFLSLKFPKTSRAHSSGPVEEAPLLTTEDIKSFEDFLTWISNYLESFDEEKARSSFAKDDFAKSRYMCGVALGESTKSGSTFCCPAKYPLNYWVAKKDGKIVRSKFFKKELGEPKEGEVFEEVYYPGCPKFRNLFK